MRNILVILFTIFYALSSSASLNMKSRDMALFDLVERFQVPYGQLTKLRDKQYLLETGNQNVLKNADFQAGTVGSGWTVNTANLDNVAFDETMKFNGIGSFQVDLKVGNYTDLEILSQSFSATDYQLTGANLEYFIRIAKSILDPAVNLKWCFYADTVQKGCVVIPSTPASTSFQEYWSAVGAEVDASTVYKVALLASYNIPTGQVGVLNVANAYLGPARRVGLRMPSVTFTADVSSAGVVSNQSPEPWISTCTFSTPYYSCTPIPGKFTANLDCSPQLADGEGSWFDGFVQNRTPASITYGWRVGSGAGVGNPAQAKHTLKCIKTGADIPQVVVDQSNGADLLGTHFYTGDAQCPINSVEGGSTISRASYPALFAKWGTTFGAGDGSTTFGVAKTNGIYIRGMGSQTISSVTYTASTRGQLRTDAIQNMTGTFDSLIKETPGGVFSTVATGLSSGSGLANYNSRVQFNAANVARTDTQTHGADIALRSCFWAVSNPYLPIAGSVTNKGGTAIKTMTEGTFNCSSSSSITSQDDTTFTSIGNISGSQCTVNMTGWNATPRCYPKVKSCSAASGAGCFLSQQNVATTATSVTPFCLSSTGAACTSFSFDMLCSGPR